MDDAPGTAADPQGSAVPRSEKSLAPAAGPSGSAGVVRQEDARRYSTPRVACDAGFDLHPGLALGMRFELPLIQRYTGRDVEVDQVLYEIWSPNSTQNPFLPGLMRDGFPLIPSKREQRRFDGHPGRFDYCEFPQYDMDDREWAPFVRRPTTIGTTESCRVGVHVLCVEWPKDPSAVAGISGRFLDSLGSWFGELGAQSEELRVQQQIADEDWARCPSLPSQEDFTTLRDCRVYEDAVDLLARMQRQMRERAAWIAMIRAMVDSSFDSSEVWVKGYPTADERYVGVFVNDAMKNKVAWLLSVRVPVFIAHRYASHEQPRSVANGTPRLTSFTEGTEVGLRKSRQANSYAFIAAREGFAVTEYEEDQGRAPDSSAAHRDPHFSSSLYLEARAKARAGQAELPREPPRRPLTGDDLRFEAPPPSSLLVHPHRVEWILPPPVPPNPVGKRWEKWEMTQDEKTSDYVFLKHGHKWRAEGEVEIWYDRHLVRELYLDDSWEMDVGVVGSAVFGAPAPRIRYYDASDQDRPRRTKPSLWMYRSRTGDPAHVGTLPQQPSAEQLP
ncbi:hypothetical protein B0H15DRAFT_787634, partial [Mycena belliarum]